MNNEKNKQIMAANIIKYRDRKGVSNQQLCDDLNIAYTTYLDWIKGVTYPRIGKVELLADYFGCEKSDLIEEKVSDMSASDRGTLEGLIGKDTELLEMIKKYMKLSDKNKKAVKQMIDTLSE